MPTELERELAVERLRKDMAANLADTPIRELGNEALDTMAHWLAFNGYAIIDENGEIVEL